MPTRRKPPTTPPPHRTARPASAERHVERAVQAIARADYAEAVRCYSRALEGGGGTAELHNDLAGAHHALWQVPEAIEHYRRAIQLQPRFATAHHNLGVTLLGIGRAEEAAEALERARALRPDNPSTLHNLMQAYARLGRQQGVDEVVRHFEAAAAANPTRAAGQLDLALALANADRMEDALAPLEAAAALEPGNPEIWKYRGLLLKELRRYPEAIACFEAALRLDPQSAEVRFYRACELLRRGDFTSGFAEYEWRWDNPLFTSPRRALPCPPWDGADPRGRTILVHTEQGFGDSIQFARWIPLLKARGARVVLECEPELYRLLSRLGAVDQLVVRGEPIPQVDAHVPLLSLPHRLGETQPPDEPYLGTSSVAVPSAARAGLRVGVVWAGSRSHVDDANRSVPLRTLRPLLALEEVEFVSLQLGAAGEIRAEGLEGRIVDGTVGLRDFADTATVIESLDLVIAVDTAVAHLAAALGKPTWILLPFDADWRWMSGRDDSPWYPSVRLFRQEQPRAWPGVIDRVRAALVALRPHPEPKSRPMLATDAPLEARESFAAAVRHHQQGHLAEAERLYRQAAELDPQLAEAHNNLGAVLGATGRTEEAEQAFRRAVALQDGYGEACNNLGLLMMHRKQTEEALVWFERAVASDPTRPDWQNHLGNAYLERLRLGDALACYDRALAIDPRLVFARSNRGVALRGMGRYDEAIAAFHSALELDPDYAEAINNLALTHRDKGEREEALRLHRRALDLAPEKLDLWVNLGITLQELGRHEEARGVAAELLSRDPACCDAHDILGHCAYEEGKLEAALEHFQRALALNPDDVNAHWNRSLINLHWGNFEAGLAEFEWRKRLVAFARDTRQTDTPHWDGSPLGGRHIMVFAEQGLGDGIQFVRYAEELKRRGAGRVSVHCAPALVELLRSAPGVDQVFGGGDPLPRFDVHAYMMSLPWLTGTRVDRIPGRVPYLFPPARPAARSVTDEPGVLKVGIVWAGNPGQARNHLRSMQLRHLRPLFEVPNTRFYSIQKGAATAELAELETGLVTDLDPVIGDFVDTAAVISRLDLVISVCTSVAHLAGALGCPTWVALARVSDWRWLEDRDDSPFYPSLRLFRQPERGEWDAVVAAMAAELRALATGGAPAVPLRDCRSEDAPAAAPPEEPVALEVPSATRDATGHPRFRLQLGMDQLAQPGVVNALQEEMVGQGHERLLRDALDELLRPGDWFVDARPGLGTLALSAATAPAGGVRVGVVCDADTAEVVQRQARSSGLAGVVESTPAPVQEAVTRWLASAPSARCFVRAADLADLAGEAGSLLQEPAVVGVLWPYRSAERDRQAASEAAGWLHFAIGRDSDGLRLDPLLDPVEGEWVVALRTTLVAEAGAADQAQAAPAAAHRRIGIAWPVGNSTGWEVYGANLATQLALRGDPLPTLLYPPELGSLSPLARLVLERAIAGAASEPEAPPAVVLHPLGNGITPAGTVEHPAGARRVGVIFFEDTCLDEAALRRGRGYDLIVAGSTWNAEVLRSRGLDNVVVSLQGIDPTLFHPAPSAGLLRDRFVVFSGGKLEYRKGQDLVVAAFREFHRRHPEALLMIAWHNHWPHTMAEIGLAGHVGGPPAVNAAGRADLVGWLARNGVAPEAVLDLGLLPNADMGRVVREAHVAVFPNRCEGGTNLVAMETMACGVPTILSANTGHLDLVDPNACYPLRQQAPARPSRQFRGVEGWGESSVEELLESLESVYSDYSEAQRRGARGAQKLSQLSWRHQTEQLLDALAGLL